MNTLLSPAALGSGVGSPSAGQESSMPEGHLVHHLARRHGTWLAGRAVAASSPQGKFPAAGEVDGCVLDAVEAWGKHLLYGFGERHLHVHLGMRGLFLDQPSPPAPPPRQVRLRLEADTRTVDLIAPGTCQLLDRPGRETLLSRLGPDPLRGADPDEVWRRLQASSVPFGAAVLDQAVVAGVGNVLRAESLFLAGIHPATLVASVERAAFDRWWAVLVPMMERAAEAGRIATRGDGRWVYEQEHCGRCDAPVDSFELRGRTAWVCPVDQLPPAAIGATRR